MADDEQRAFLAPVIELHGARRGGLGLRRRRAGLLYWTVAAVDCVNALCGAGFALLALRQAGFAEPAALRAAARSLPLAVAALCHLVVVAPASLCTLTLLLGFVQLLDFGAGIVCRDTAQIIGALPLAVVTLACAIPMVAEQLGAARAP